MRPRPFVRSSASLLWSTQPLSLATTSEMCDLTFVKRGACLHSRSAFLLHPWVTMRACRSTASCLLGATRALLMLDRPCWWGGGVSDRTPRWKLRHSLQCQARKSSRLAVPWPTVSASRVSWRAPTRRDWCRLSRPSPGHAQQYHLPRASHRLLQPSRLHVRCGRCRIYDPGPKAQSTRSPCVRASSSFRETRAQFTLGGNGLQSCSTIARAVYRTIGILQYFPKLLPHPNGTGVEERVNPHEDACARDVCSRYRDEMVAMRNPPLHRVRLFLTKQIDQHCYRIPFSKRSSHGYIES